MNLGIYNGHCLYVKDLASDFEQHYDYHDDCKAQFAMVNWKKKKDLCAFKKASEDDVFIGWKQGNSSKFWHNLKAGWEHVKKHRRIY